MSYPETVGASSVYADDERPNAEDTGTASLDEPSATALAAAASGVDGSYTSGMQDGTVRPNKHTSADMAAAHRSQALVANDWFFGGKAQVPEETEVGPHNAP